MTAYSTEWPFSIRKRLIRFAELYRNRRGVRWIAAPRDQSLAWAVTFKPTGFARYLNTSVSTVQKWETGVKRRAACRSSCFRSYANMGFRSCCSDRFGCHYSHIYLSALVSLKYPYGNYSNKNYLLLISYISFVITYHWKNSRKNPHCENKITQA